MVTTGLTSENSFPAWRSFGRLSPFADTHNWDAETRYFNYAVLFSLIFFFLLKLLQPEDILILSVLLWQRILSSGIEMPQKPPTFSAAPCTDSNILGSLSWLYSSTALLSVEMCHRIKVKAKKLHTQYQISRFSEEKGILAFIYIHMRLWTHNQAGTGFLCKKYKWKKSGYRYVTYWFDWKNNRLIK